MRVRGWLTVGGATVITAVAAVAGWTAPAQAASSAVVAKDGSGNYTSVQAAVNAVPANNSSRFTITIKPGTYYEPVTVAANKPYVSFVGSTGNAADVVITYDRASGTKKSDGSTYGTSGSASVTISAHDFVAQYVTFSNSFNEAAHPEITSQQAVAVNAQGDRATFDQVRFLGNQDTLLLWSASTGTRTRSYFRGSYIEGDVDFIFGRGTGVFDRCNVKSLSRGSSSNNGYITAAATDSSNPYGFLFYQSNFTSNAPAGTVYLGRPWHPSGDVNAVAQVTYRESTLGAHIKTGGPWTDMSGFSWRTARFSEYLNTGPGATVNSNRPQLSAAQAVNYTPQKYLAGSDGWNPVH
jgi:pectinesterase